MLLVEWFWRKDRVLWEQQETKPRKLKEKDQEILRNVRH